MISAQNRLREHKSTKMKKDLKIQNHAKLFKDFKQRYQITQLFEVLTIIDMRSTYIQLDALVSKSVLSYLNINE